MSDKRPYDLNRDSYRLMMDEPFFASLFRRLDKRASTELPTAGVRLNKETLRFELLYNPEFFQGLTPTQRKDVLKHEGYHIVLGHCTGRQVADQHHMRWNIATDLAINSHLENLPDGCCMPGEGQFAHLPPHRAAEWYFKQLEQDEQDKQDEQEGNGDSGDSEGEGDSEGSAGQSSEAGEEGDSDSAGNGKVDPQFDDHGNWSDSDVGEAEREVAKARLSDIVREAMEDANDSRQWGSVSASCRKEIEKIHARSTINWRTVLRWFVQSSRPANRSSSIRRLSKRYPWQHPGRKTNRVANIAISIDQSGSVSDSMLEAFYVELSALSKLAGFTVIPFDSEVFEDGIHEWKKGQTMKAHRYRYGGTDFDPPTEYVNKRREFDAHIVLTDLCASKPKASRVPRMWITTERYAKSPYFQTSERILAIPQKDLH